MNPAKHVFTQRHPGLRAAPVIAFLAALLIASLTYGTGRPSVSAQIGHRTHLPIVLANCGGWEQALINPSFEEGVPSWTIEGNARLSRTTSSDGYYSMLFGTLEDAEDIIYQSVTVPDWTNAATLYADWDMWTYETGDVVYDSLFVVLYDETLATEIVSGTVTNLDTQGAWTTMVLPVENAETYHGHEWTVVVAGITDGSIATWWYVDNVRLSFSCTGIEGPSVTMTAIEGTGLSLAEAAVDLAAESAPEAELSAKAQELVQVVRAGFQSAERP
ncbi:MAG: hypothetical protein ACYC5M_17910 [Anaerolineae bacterium]